MSDPNTFYDGDGPHKKGFFRNIFHNRIMILLIVILVLIAYIVQHLFVMQIINGSDYETDYIASIEKTISTDGVRGNIYDCNGELLAYDEVAYKITIEDSGTYESEDGKSAETVKNEALNAEMNALIEIIEDNGDEILNSFSITMNKKSHKLSFNVSGTTLQRFRADVFGYSTIDELTDNEEWGFDESKATAKQIYNYLADSFGLTDTEEYGVYRTYQILVLRYTLNLNRYQKYVTATVATDVSDETVAEIYESRGDLEGVDVEETTKRVYTYPEEFSSIIGYTGTISTEEYEEYSEEDDTYSLSDQVGKAGIEQTCESILRGEKGEETIYVNNVGKVLETVSSTDAGTGDDIYLSIDADLQVAVYQLLEQEIAGILYSSLKNVKTYDDDEDVYTPVYDVYTALLTNNVLDLDKLKKAKDGTYSAAIYSVYKNNRKTVFSDVKTILNSEDTAYKYLSDGMQEIVTYIVETLQDDAIFDADAVSSSDELYQSWKEGNESVKTYLKYAIEQGWIEGSSLDTDLVYADTDELYAELVRYIMSDIRSSTDFDKIIYKYLVLEDQILPGNICLALYEQGLLEEDEDYDALISGTMSCYEFVKAKIKSLEITPAQLGLDPCSGSVVITDPDTGEIRACVSYPGYDSNQLSSGSDSSYYNDLVTNASLPLYNYATQQVTAPGSTFKMLTAIAGVGEGVLSVSETIKDEGVFEEVGMSLHCWIYPSSHGRETLTSALRDSCNYYFAEVGYRLSTTTGSYSEENGISTILEYAQLFGFGEQTGVETAENTGQVATELPVSAAIGQSNNSYTTIQLARYVTAIANRGTVYDFTLLSKITDADGETLEEFSPTVRNTVDDVSDYTWSAITTGMTQVIATHDQFDEIDSVKLAGKTGTAQESETRPNHALFVGFAPYDDPEVAIAVRIAYGYGSSNACELAANVMKYYYGLEKNKKLLDGTADSATSGSSFDD